jgi:hypothetical protein
MSSVLELSTKLSARVIEGVADRSDRGEHAVIVERLRVVDRGVVTTRVGMVDERDVGAGRSLVKCHPQRVQHDAERVLTLDHRSGRSKTSGLELGQMRTKGARLFHIRDGKVTRLVVYFDPDRALAELGLVREAHADETPN